ncbi:MAG: O-antigen ligase family protein, partial [Candidatus Magasanikbacteria bacterium]
IQKYVNPELLLNRAQERVSASLGNAIYFSGYGLFLFFLGLYLFIEEKKKEWTWSMFGLGLIGLLGVFLGGTRGTLLGFFAMMSVSILLYSLFWKENKKVRMYLRIAVVAGVLLFGLVWRFQDTEVVKSIPGVQRLIGENILEGTGETRLMAWKIAVEGSKEHILFGWGPNNYYYLFNKYYNPKFLEQGWGETWFDNAHSAIFNTLAVQGSIGILLYFSFFLVAIFSLYRVFKEKKEYIHVFVLTSAFLIGHFIHNAFVFENPTSYLYFFFVLAFVASVMQWKIEVPSGKNKTVSTGMVSGIFLIAIFFTFVFNVNPARANIASFNSLQALVSGRSSISIFEGVLSIPSPHRDDIRSDIARTIVDVSDTYVQAGRKEEMISYLQFAQAEVDKNMVLHPADVRLHLLSYEIQKHLMTYRENTEHVFVSERVLEEALKYSPERQQLLYNLALVKVQVNKPEEALKLLETAVDGDPQIMESWWRLASVYQYMGDNTKAMSILDEGEQKARSISDYDKKIIQQLRDYVPKE